ncbi:MAG: GNAT family N-acetyltransferase [archaeon]|nr:GNAT family N-acetyltransferase [archaeon]
MRLIIMDKVIIRDLRFKDFEGVREIDNLTQRIYLGKKWDSFSVLKKEKYLVSRKSEFKMNCKTKYSLVALIKNKLVGFIFAYETLPFKDKIYVRHLAVHPDFQKQMIGKKLYEAFIKNVRLSSKKEIEAGINPDNLPSISLHEKMGFNVIDWKKATLG